MSAPSPFGVDMQDRSQIVRCERLKNAVLKDSYLMQEKWRNAFTLDGASAEALSRESHAESFNAQSLCGRHSRLFRYRYNRDKILFGSADILCNTIFMHRRGGTQEERKRSRSDFCAPISLVA